MARNSIWDSRNLISSWPSFAVLLGALLSYPRLRWRVTAVAFVIAPFAIGSAKMLGNQVHRPDYKSAVSYIDRTGTDNEPVVDWSDLTPGPPSELEAAFALAGGAEHHPVVRLGSPPLSAVLHSPPDAILPAMPGQSVARQAAILTRRHGLFLVLPVPIAVRALDVMRRAQISSTQTSNFLMLLAAFLGALPTRYHITAVHSYSGIHHVTVYTYRG